jgi:phosphoenolpyruvate phosphomutase
MKKTTQFRNLLQSEDLGFICEAHNGISAKIVEEAGFKGIWGSGLTISASHGVRDSNELSWTQVLDAVEFMTDQTGIPLMLDGDTGYGNFNNVRRLVRHLEKIDVAAVCMEDKIFPKTNSFIGSKQKLADIDEFTGKIKAAKDSQRDDDFNVVARTEAFISGLGLSEALKRAEAYRKAGADAILVHSKISTENEVAAFMSEWGDRHPIVIVPTMYYNVPTEIYRELGVSLVIWANHLLRASVDAMQKTAANIFENQSLKGVEEKVVPVKELFRLQNASELKSAEDRYLPKNV